jgi:hypothetical protein
MFRWILWILLFYLGYKILKGLTASPPKKKDEVMGKKKTKPLDLSKSDVQDARFEDIDDKKNEKKS